MQQKIKLLFDGSFLANAGKKDSSRSGIYFVAYNVLKGLAERSEFEVYIYSEPKALSGVLAFLDTQDIAGLKIAGFYDAADRLLAGKKAESKQLKSFSGAFGKKFFAAFLSGFLTVFVKLKNILTFKKVRNKNYLDNFSVYFSPFKIFPKFIESNHKIKKYLILYDCTPIVCKQIYTKKEDRNTWFSDILFSLTGENHYFAISEATKNDFIKYSDKLKPENISVIPLAASSSFYVDTNQKKSERIRDKYNIPNAKYIVSVSTLEPRKNIIFTLKAFIKFIDKHKINDLYFVLVGSYRPDFADVLNKEICGLEKYQDKIIKAGYVDDADLASLYTNAFALAYVSLYEGFGLPPLEAMQCGCPVITSGTSSLPEVVGDAGIMVNPIDADELMAAYEKLYLDEDYRSSLAKKGFERAKLFTWDKTVSIIINKIKKDIS